jgi:hypothetical protein
MYITRIPNRGSPPAILLREGYRQDGRVKTRTLANLSKLPPEAIELLRLYLKGHQLVPAAEAFDVIASLHHGHVEAVLLTMRRLGFASLLASRSSRARELVLALVAARILEPESKLATTRSWHVTSLPTTLGVADADADELYAAMDWLLQRQDRIEQKLAARHLHNDGLALYDPELQLFRGPPLSPGFTGPQSRRQERQAAGQLRPFDQRTGPARFGVGLQRQHGRSDDLAPRGREDAKRLWHATHRFGRRSGDDHPEAGRRLA